MKKKDFLKELVEGEELISDNFLNSTNTGKYSAKLSAENPQQLMDLICNLIKICIRALEDGEHIEDPHIPNPVFPVSETLRMVLDIMPHQHFELMEELEKQLIVKNNNNS